MNEELKKAIDNCALIGISTMKLVDDSISEEDFDRAIRLDMAKFAMYIVSSNGRVTWEETQKIAYYFGLDLSPADVNILVRQFNVFDDVNNREPSLMLRTAVELDNLIYNSSNIENPDKWTSEIYYYIFCLLKDEVMSADCELDEKVKKNIDEYLNCMKQYIDDHLEARKTDSGVIGG